MGSVRVRARVAVRVTQLEVDVGVVAGLESGIAVANHGCLCRCCRADGNDGAERARMDVFHVVDAVRLDRKSEGAALGCQVGNLVRTYKDA